MPTPSRRNLMKTTAWTVPTVAVASAAPAIAATTLPTLHVFETAGFGRRRLNYVSNSSDMCYASSGSPNYQSSGLMFTNQYPQTTGRELDNITINNCTSVSSISSVCTSLWTYFGNLTWKNSSTDTNTSCWSVPKVSSTQVRNGVTYYEYRSCLTQSCVASCFVSDGKGGLTLQGLSGSCGFLWYSNCQLVNTTTSTQGTNERSVNVTASLMACGQTLTAERGWGEMSI